MAKHSHHNPVAGYIMVALILGVITYLEFAMVEYPQAWLGSTWTLILLVILSVAKFVMVIMFFMHLKEDDRAYSGFFGSGMFFALGTFIAMAAMFVLPRAVAVTRPAADTEVHAAAHGTSELPPELVDLIASDGRSRTAAGAADSPRPADRTATIAAPLAANDASSYELSEGAGITAAAPTPAAPGEAAATDQVAATEPAAPAAEAAAAAEPATEEVGAQEPAAEASVTWDEELGQQVYMTNCMACHQVNGQGIPGAFPPLADHAADLYAVDGGELLTHIVLFGLQGQISVNGMTYNGFMPAWPQLSDEQLANVLNHVVTKLNTPPADFVPFQAADLAAERSLGLSAVQVHEQRVALGLP